MRACGGGRGTAISHRGAAFLLELDGFDSGVLELTTSRRLRSHSIIVHTAAPIPPGQLVCVDGIPFTSATRTLVDLASVVDAEALEIALDAALRRRLTTLARLEWHLRQLDRRRRKGLGALTRLIQERRRGARTSESPVEVKVFRTLVRAGLPHPVKQHEVRDEDGRLVARVDLAYPEARVAIEADGYRWHAGRREWERDLRRRNALGALGWTVLHATSSDGGRRSAQFAARVRSLLRLEPNS